MVEHVWTIICKSSTRDLQDVQMVWVGGNLLYGNNTILEKVKPSQCEDLKVYGSNKPVCVRNTTEQVPKKTRHSVLSRIFFSSLIPD
jgi:hypothetical protein